MSLRPFQRFTSRFGIILLLVSLPSCKNETSGPSSPNEPWRNFTKANSPLPSNVINGLTLETGGTVWFATNEGAASYNQGYWGTIKDSLTWYDGRTNEPARIVTAICQGQDRSLWFGLRGGGLVRYSPFSDVQVWWRYNFPTIADDAILSATADLSQPAKYGDVWVTTNFGISHFIGTVNQRGIWESPYTRSNIEQMPTNQIWSSGMRVIDNTVWFGTRSGGPVTAQYGVDGTLFWTSYPLPPEYDSQINSIGFDLSTTVWFGRNGGVSSYDTHTSTWTHYTNASTGGKLPSGPVNAVLVNSQTTRWFGTDSGLVRFRDTTWTLFTHANTPQLPNDTITALTYDRRQNLWIGTKNGAAEFNEGGIK